MNNPLLYNLSFTEKWLSLNAVIDLIIALGCFYLIASSALKFPQRFKRHSFIMAVLIFFIYQLPLVIFSPLFYNHLPNAIWFSTSIHVAIIVNLLWVCFTPGLAGLSGQDDTKRNSRQPYYSEGYFKGFVFWLPISIFIILLALYFYKIPFSCTALYALFADQSLTLLVREILGKLMGRTYAPHVLNILTSAVGPIAAFLLLGRIYFDAKAAKWLYSMLWVLLFIVVLITPLLGGAKGSLVPMAVALSVAGFLVAKNWKSKIFIVAGIIAIFSATIIFVKVTQEKNSGSGSYQFGSCVARLNVCERTKNLLESLRPPKSYYGMTREQLDKLGNEVSKACNSPAIIADPLPEDIDNGNIADSQKTLSTHINGLFYRVIANPVQVASWHYLYVADYGPPGFLGLSIAKVFSNNYISVPANVCEIYYSGDKTSACTAPTSYIFTYPAYLGVSGLVIACLATIIFDIVISLLVKHSVKPFSDLTIGIMAVASVNFIVADYTTVIISHGAGAAIVILMLICFYIRLKNKKNPEL